MVHSGCAPHSLIVLSASAHLSFSPPLPHRAGADPEFEVNKLTELCWAAGKGRAGVVRALIEIGRADPQRVDTEGTNALMCAAYGGHPEVVQVLLDSGRLDPNATSKRGAVTALMLAAGSPSPTASSGFLFNLSRGGVMQALYNLRGATSSAAAAWSS